MPPGEVPPGFPILPMEPTEVMTEDAVNAQSSVSPPESLKLMPIKSLGQDIMTNRQFFCTVTDNIGVPTSSIKDRTIFALIV